MSQQRLTESHDKTQQRLAPRKTSQASAQSLQGGLHPILQLQRTLGNRRVAQLLQAKRLTPEGKILGLQRKLTVGAADDPYEQEADRVAHHVMHTSDAVAAPAMQRAMSPEEDQDQMLQTKPLAASITPFMQRQTVPTEASEDQEQPVQAKLFSETSSAPLQRQPETEEDDTEPIQAKSAGSMSDSFEAGADVETQVSQSKGRGSPLPDPVRAYMEPRFGVDFSQVRVHTGSDALQMNQAVGAQAFTHGSDIYFGAGSSPTNLALTAHELTHVVQQTGGAPLQTKKLDETSSANTDPSIQRTCAACGAGRIEKKESGISSQGVSINDDKGLEREADVMGANAHVLGEQAEAAGFHARLATASGAGLDDEPYVVAMTPTAQRVVSLLAKPRVSTSNVPVIQRAANFVAGTVSATTNMASHLIAGRRDAGFTPPMLNGTTILSAAAAQGAIRAPTLTGRSNPDGTVGAMVATVPTNEASFTMQVPSGGPWSTVTSKTNVATLFAGLGLAAQAGCSTAGDSTFSVNGRPTDAAFATNVRTHENLHAADHRTGFSSVIVPWDARLEAARTAGTVFNGATQVDAEAALFTAMGGTPNQIATAQHNRWLALNNVTHTGATLATGGPATPSNSAANATCTTSSLDAT